MVTQYLKISLEQYAITGRSSKEHVHYLALLGLMGHVPPGVYLITVTADAVVLRVRGVNIVVQRRLIFKAHRRKALDGFYSQTPVAVAFVVHAVTHAMQTSCVSWSFLPPVQCTWV